MTINYTRKFKVSVLPLQETDKSTEMPQISSFQKPNERTLPGGEDLKRPWAGHLIRQIRILIKMNY